MKNNEIQKVTIVKAFFHSNGIDRVNTYYAESFEDTERLSYLYKNDFNKMEIRCARVVKAEDLVNNENQGKKMVFLVEAKSGKHVIKKVFNVFESIFEWIEENQDYSIEIKRAIID